MELWEQINNDIKTAMKAKDKDKLTALRAIKAELLIAKTAENAATQITEEQSIKILQKMVKQRKESAQIYQQENRNELAQQELAEANYIQEYLPKQITDSELEETIKKIIAQTGATSIKDMGKVMGIANTQLAGKAEGKSIAAKVKTLLK